MTLPHQPGIWVIRNELDSLPQASLIEQLRCCWSIDVQDLRYAPVGAGSFHWIAEDAERTRWFVTADSLQRIGNETGRTVEAVFEDLRAACETAAALRESGLSFVVTPVACQAGELIRRLSLHWAVAVFPYIEGHAAGPGEWTAPGLCARAAERVGRLHASEPPRAVKRLDFAIPRRAAFLEALNDQDRPWTQGPYGERTRRLLASDPEGVEALFTHYDQLAEKAAADGSDPWVATHGEPHSANFIDGVDGDLHLIDWDTVRLAPRERDLFALMIDDPQVLTAYQRAVGNHVPRPAAMDLFRVRWALMEICEYVTRFHGPHGDGLDEQASWEELMGFLPVKCRWPEM